MVSGNAIVTPIDYAWVSTTGETGDRNYDEFQSESEIIAIIRQHPTSIMAVEMPHCTPEMLAKHATWEESRHFAAHKLATLKASHLFKPATHSMFLYEILNRERDIRLSGVGAMFSTQAIWDQHTNPEGKLFVARTSLWQRLRAEGNSCYRRNICVVRLPLQFPTQQGPLSG
jgi:hypothetical protein